MKIVIWRKVKIEKREIKIVNRGVIAASLYNYDWLGELQRNLYQFTVMALPTRLIYFIAISIYIAIGINTCKVTLQHIENHENQPVYECNLVHSFIIFPLRTNRAPSQVRFRRDRAFTFPLRAAGPRFFRTNQKGDVTVVIIGDVTVGIRDVTAVIPN